MRIFESCQSVSSPVDFKWSKAVQPHSTYNRQNRTNWGGRVFFCSRGISPHNDIKIIAALSTAEAAIKKIKEFNLWIYYTTSARLSQTIVMVKRAFSGAYFWCLFGVCFYKNRQKETNVRKVEISKNRMIPPFIALYKCVQKSFWRIQVPSLAPSEQGPEFGAQKWDNPDSGLFFYAKTPAFKPFF